MAGHLMRMRSRRSCLETLPSRVPNPSRSKNCFVSIGVHGLFGYLLRGFVSLLCHLVTLTAALSHFLLRSLPCAEPDQPTTSRRPGAPYASGQVLQLTTMGPAKALRVLDENWWSKRHPRRMDVFGDFAGEDIFFVDGNSMLQEIFEDPLVSIGKGSKWTSGS